MPVALKRSEFSADLDTRPVLSRISYASSWRGCWCRSSLSPTGSISVRDFFDRIVMAPHIHQASGKIGLIPLFAADLSPISDVVSARSALP